MMKTLELKKRTLARLQDEKLKMVQGAAGNFSKNQVPETPTADAGKGSMEESKSCCKKSCN